MIAFDVDSVLAQFTKNYLRLLRVVSGRLSADVGFTDHPPEWHWELRAGFTKEHLDEVWGLIDGSKTFWTTLDPYPDTPEVVAQLNRLSREGHGVFFITNRSHGVGVRRQTEEWLHRQGVEYPSVIVTAAKTPVLKGLGATFFIDDNLPNIHDATAGVVAHEHFYLLDRSYNREGRQPHVKAVDSIEGAMRAAGIWHG